MELFNFQKKALRELFFNFKEGNNKLLLISPTGSGKTNIALKVVDEWRDNFYEDIIYLWIAPGTGFLHEQSFKRARKTIKTKSVLLENEIQHFESGKIFFINWEKINKKTNKLNKKIGDLITWESAIRKSKNISKIFLIIDEEHLAHSDKSNEIIDQINPEFLLRLSATPKDIGKETKEINVDKNEVINNNLIRNEIIINESVYEGDVFNDKIAIQKGINKSKELKKLYKREGYDINPLTLIQLPVGNDKKYIDSIVKEVISNGVSKVKIAIWLTDQKINLDTIDEMDVLLFKNAIATGWDYPRAQVLVKLREVGSRSFHIQTLGRIMRNIKKVNFTTGDLNKAYLFTIDKKLKTEAIKHLNGKEIIHSKLNKDYYNLKVPRSTLKNRVSNNYYEIFRINVIKKLRKIKDFQFDDLNMIEYPVMKGNDKFITKINVVSNEFDKDQFRRNFWRAASDIAFASKRLSYSQVVSILKTVFHISSFNPIKKLNTKDFYSFTIKNKNKLSEIFHFSSKEQEKIIFEEITKICLPKIQKSMVSNSYSLAKKAIYNNYPINQYDSKAELEFINYIELTNKFDAWFKNTVVIDSPLNIAYNFNGEIKNFKPDFLLLKNQKIVIAEIKGEKDIDKFTEYKYNAAKIFFKNQGIDFILVRLRNDELVYWDEMEYCYDLRKYKEIKWYE